jgi:hypothetical protein
MESLSDFVTELLETHGAVVEALEPDGLEVLAPAAVSEALGWPEIARLGFGVEMPEQAIRIGLEGDWLDRFGGLLGARGRWVERQVTLAGSPPAPDPERLIAGALDLPNAVWRFQRMTATWTRCLILTFRYTALSDEKREGLAWLGFNLGTGAALDDAWMRRHAGLAAEPVWRAPDAAVRHAAGSASDAPLLEARVRPLLDYRVRQELEPFVRAMHRRLDRDRARVHAYHNDLRSTALKRLAGLAGAAGEKREADRRRETLRVAAIEREYRAKLDDLRHNYALRVTVEWVQALELYLPVQRLEVLIRRRKGERLIRLDWDQAARRAELPPCEWGLGLDRVRLVCDEKLHLTEPAGQAPCPSCGKPWCRACHPLSCTRCRQPVDRHASARPGDVDNC